MQAVRVEVVPESIACGDMCCLRLKLLAASSHPASLSVASSSPPKPSRFSLILHPPSSILRCVPRSLAFSTCELSSGSARSGQDPLSRSVCFLVKERSLHWCALAVDFGCGDSIGVDLAGEGGGQRRVLKRPRRKSKKSMEETTVAMTFQKKE